MADDGTQFESLNLAELRAHPDRVTAGQRIALVRTEQRRAWAAGERPSVEELLKRFPALAGDAEATIDLAYSEYILRTEGGEKVDPEELCRRFPKNAQAIRRQLTLHMALQQMTFTSVDTAQIKRSPSATDVGGPPIFDSMPPSAPATIAAEAAEVFQTLMQSPASASQGGAAPALSPDGDVSVPGYEIISELGRGGMGVVYKARQHRLDRLVALKMILSGEFASKIDRDRFREEAVKLARVQHQNIVQIYEVSEYENRPYFAMEYLDGGSLSKEISAQPLTPRIAARLILALANAMQTAHEKGIVHRDLKPGNILLTAGGLRKASERGVSLNMSLKSAVEMERGPIPKITDFGLAKGMTGEESRTVSGAVLGTPSYMAPEQARGQSKRVGPPADIYALGAILYECLTGRPPFLAPNAIDTIYLVVHEEPPKPTAWDPKIPQDLETICLKCLEKTPEKRYATSKALAEDLEAFLDNRPIKARPIGMVERGIKWAKRRPAQAALVGTIALAAVVLLGIGAWVSEQRRQNLNIQQKLTDEAVAERKKAVDNADEAIRQKVEAEKQKKIAEANEAEATRQKDEVEKQRKIAVANAEEANRQKVEADKQRGIAVTNAEEATRQRNEAKTNEQLANKMFGYARDAVNEYFTSVSQETLLDEPGMEELRKRLLEQASKFYTKFAEERKNDPSVRAELAAALGRLGKIRAAIDLKSEGLGLYQQALDLYKALNAEKPGDRNIEASLTGTYFEMGVLYRGTKDEAQAVAFGQQAVNGWTALACLEPDNETYQAELARSWNGLGATFAEFKKYDAAREPLNQALSIRRMLVDTHPDTETTLRDLAVTYANVAWVAENRDDFRGAEEAYKEALAIAEPLYKRNSDRTLYRDDVARYFLNLGVLYSNNADPKLAADSFTQAAENWTELVRTHPKVKQFRYSAAKSERLVAGSEFRLSMNKEPQDYESKAKRALKRARDQITILLQEEPDNPDYVAEAALIDIVDGDQLRDRRSNSEAVEAYRRAIQSFSGLLQKRDDPINKRSLANGLLQLGVCLQRIEQPSDGRAARIAEALKSLTQSSVIWKELVTNDPQNYRTRRIAVECLVEVARLTIEEGDPQAALLAANDAVKIGEPMRNDSRFGSRERLVLQRAYWRQAQALTASGKYDDALAAWDAALQLEEGNDRKTSFFNIYRLATLACTPKFADAVKQAETYRREFGRNGYGLYELARIGALAARTAGGNSTDDKTQSGQFAVVAVLDLVNSRKLMGDNDPKVRAALAADRDWAALRTNRDWDALRQRDDFRKLLGEVFAGRTTP